MSRSPSGDFYRAVIDLTTLPERHMESNRCICGKFDNLDWTLPVHATRQSVAMSVHASCDSDTHGATNMTSRKALPVQGPQK